MKKLLSIILALVLLSAFTVTGFAATAELSLNYNAKALKAGETVTVSYKIVNNPGFGTLTARVTFDNSLFELKSVSEKIKITAKNYQNVHVNSTVATANKNGWYKIGWAPNVLDEENTFSSPVTFNGELATFTFTAKKDATPNFWFSYVNMYKDDANFTDIPYSLKVNATKSELLPTVSEANNSKSNGNAGNTVSAVSSTVSNTASESASAEVNENETTESTASEAQQPEKANGTNGNLILIIGIAAAVLVAAAVVTAIILAKKKKKETEFLG